MKPNPPSPTDRNCKGYFVVPSGQIVKSILPRITFGRIDKRDWDRIIELSIQPTVGSGGPHARFRAARIQERQPNQIWQPQPPSRAGAGCAVSKSALLRPPRSGAGEVRNAAQGPSRRAAARKDSRQLWFLAGDVLPGSGAFWERRTSWTAATPQRTPTRVQAVRESPLVPPQYSGDRASLTGHRLEPAGEGTIRSFHSSPQYRTRIGPEAKKSNPVQTKCLVKPRDATLLVQRYEEIREQVLLCDKCGDPPDPERFVMEQAGLAAWIETFPYALSTPILHSGFRIEEPWQKEFVLRLADLVVGQRRELKNG